MMHYYIAIDNTAGTTIASTKSIIITAEIILCDFLLFQKKFIFFTSLERLLYMIFPIFTTFVIFSGLVFIYMKKTQNSIKIVDDDFLEREHEANNTRKKSLDDVKFINIPYDKLPFDKAAFDEPLLDNDTSVEPGLDKTVFDESLLEKASSASEIIKLQKTVLSFKNKKIVNLNGITNTDLKLRYGVANITVLSEYDENYTIISKAMAEWADLLVRENRKADAKIILEATINEGFDIKSLYINLADIYAEEGNFQKIEELIAKAEELNGIMKNPILKDLKLRSLSYPSY